MFAALERYLKNENYPASIIHCLEFTSSKQVLEGKCRELRSAGMGKMPNMCESLSNAEEETLWLSEKFGSKSPRALINTVWWDIVQHFGLRVRDRHYDLQVGDFSIKKDDSQRGYVEYIEGLSKTNQSGLNFRPRLIFPRMYATNTESIYRNVQKV